MDTIKQIVGISLVRNEDLFIERVLTNAYDFCDKIMVAVHRSTDRTSEIVERLAREKPRVTVHAVNDPSESHELIRTYANTPTWIFALDGDEVYDPERLRILREEILTGSYDRFRQIYGSALHCDQLDLGQGTAGGYLTPPCRTMTKLYNFEALEDWEGPCPQRVHGGRIIFREGYDESMNANLYQEYDWDHCPFRCLHLVFLRRSSVQPDRLTARMNYSEKINQPWLNRISTRVMTSLGREPVSQYKFEKYKRGPRVTKDIQPFIREPLPASTGGK